MLCTNFSVASFNGCRNKQGSQFFSDAPLAQASPANFRPKRFFGKIVPNPSCIPNLKLLVSTVAEINRGPTFFDAPLAKTPTNFGPKHLFGKLVPNQICVPN